jgi:hypothetical protein
MVPHRVVTPAPGRPSDLWLGRDLGAATSAPFWLFSAPERYLVAVRGPCGHENATRSTAGTGKGANRAENEGGLGPVRPPSRRHR